MIVSNTGCTVLTEPIKNDLNEQSLGLIDNHIHYFAQNSQYPEKKIGIHQDMLLAFQALVTKGKENGITIEIASGYRSFERQLSIWNNKYLGKTHIKDINGQNLSISTLSSIEITQAILLFSALPGASRHHWGCDIDVYAPNLLAHDQHLQLEPWEYETSGPMAKLSDFLAKEAQALGFYFPYDHYRGGVAKEPWHLSYAPVACIYEQAFNIDILKACLHSSKIQGKEAIINNLTDIVKQFVININNESSINTQLIGISNG